MVPASWTAYAVDKKMKNFKATLEGLRKLHEAEQLDNVLIAGVLPVTELEGWNVRVLGTDVEVVAS